MIIDDLKKYASNAIKMEDSQDKEDSSILDFPILDPDEDDADNESEIVIDGEIELPELVLSGEEPPHKPSQLYPEWDTDPVIDIEPNEEAKSHIIPCNHLEVEVTPDIDGAGYISPSGFLFRLYTSSWEHLAKRIAGVAESPLPDWVKEEFSYNKTTFCCPEELFVLKEMKYAKVKSKIKWDKQHKLEFTFLDILTDKQYYSLLPSFGHQLDYAVDSLLARIDKEVPVTGRFNPIDEYFENLDRKTRNDVGKYCLRIYKMSEDVVPDASRRYVEAAAYPPSGAYKANLTVAYGTNEEIKNKLMTQETRIRINEAYGKLLDCLMHD